jgi:hypothetical protein
LKRQAEEQPAMGAPLTSSKGEVVRQGSGRPPRAPFEPSTLRRRALAVWKAAGLAPIGLRECRHTFASLIIASGVNAKALCSYMGHAPSRSPSTPTASRMPGNEEEAAGLLDAYLARGASRDNGAIPDPESVRSSAVESRSNSPGLERNRSTAGCRRFRIPVAVPQSPALPSRVSSLQGFRTTRSSGFRCAGGCSGGKS